MYVIHEKKNSIPLIQKERSSDNKITKKYSITYNSISNHLFTPIHLIKSNIKKLQVKKVELHLLHSHFVPVTWFISVFTQKKMYVCVLVFSSSTKTKWIARYVCSQGSYQRWLDKMICKTEIKFWAILGSQGFREKNNLPTAISMQLFGVFF